MSEILMICGGAGALLAVIALGRTLAAGHAMIIHMHEAIMGDGRNVLPLRTVVEQHVISDSHEFLTIHATFAQMRIDDIRNRDADKDALLVAARVVAETLREENAKIAANLKREDIARATTLHHEDEIRTGLSEG